MIETQLKNKKYEEIIGEFNAEDDKYFKKIYQIGITNSMKKEAHEIKKVTDEEVDEEIRQIQESKVKLIKKYVKLYDDEKYKDLKKVILDIIRHTFKRLNVKSENWNWINTYLLLILFKFSSGNDI